MDPSVQLSNGNESREQRVYGQKVYVNYEQAKTLLSDKTPSTATLTARERAEKHPVHRF